MNVASTVTFTGFKVNIICAIINKPVLIFQLFSSSVCSPSVSPRRPRGCCRCRSWRRWALVCLGLADPLRCPFKNVLRLTALLRVCNYLKFVRLITPSDCIVFLQGMSIIKALRDNFCHCHRQTEKKESKHRHGSILTDYILYFLVCTQMYL